MQIIANEQDLDAFIIHALSEKFVSCDTEFVRVRTYYPELALIQIATSERVVLIDPLLIKDFTSLKTLFENKDIVKIFHAPRQDLEIMREGLGIKPYNIFDTQVAASLMGFPDQIGYEGLVREILEIQLDKSAQFTNWIERPLSEEQLTYAAADVIYLLQVYKKMQTTLGERFEWAQKLCAPYNEDDLYKTDLVPAFLKWAQRIKKEEQRVRLWIGLNWREERAKKINRPRLWILKDADLLAFSRAEEGTFPPGLVKAGQQDYKTAQIRVKEIMADAPDALTGKQKDDLKLLREKFGKLAEEHKLPLRFAVSKQDLETYVRHNTMPPHASDWQKTLFWDKLHEVESPEA